ncbi:RNA polymerase sigma factor [Phenylobacterium sp.]|uniref:RNA polymerase sigma factor n=1 Tax=Phenylobacterium sp. TaxID=1871053 RepID=UPI002E31BEC1|nr:sigma-70 family RNA polymerase sigma factor [Phenylobacterium sp.]HEX4711983.1 sigma-70 family RNA polymerase sigma factor [Phenylobacterium sp.]
MALRGHSSSALLELYLERRADLVRFFTIRLRSVAAAEDLVQDIYVRLSCLDDHTEIQNPTAYLYRLGSNLMLDRLRGERRTAHRDGAWLDSQTVRIGNEEISAEPSAEAAVAARQRLALLTAAIQDLNPQTQRIFRMHKFEGLSHPQVAAALGISRSAVEKHMMAALKHLLARLP